MAITQDFFARQSNTPLTGGIPYTATPSAAMHNTSTMTIPLPPPPPTTYPTRMTQQLCRAPLVANFCALPAPIIKHYTIEALWMLLLLSIPLAFYTAHHTKRHLQLQTYATRAETAQAKVHYAPLWHTHKWWVLSGLCDHFLAGDLLAGIWTAECAQSLLRKPDTRYLRRLVRMGIYPLYIQDGGLSTHQEKPLSFTKWGVPELPRYVQSKKRAVFKFVVPKARGYAQYRKQDDTTDEAERARQDRDRHYFNFVAEVAATEGWCMHLSGEEEGPIVPVPSPVGDLPYEVGASSWCKAFLPFKRDSVLKEAKGDYEDYMEDYLLPASCYLLQRQALPIIRIEAPDFQVHRLDEQVYRLARIWGLDNGWHEDVMRMRLADEFERLRRD